MFGTNCQKYDADKETLTENNITENKATKDKATEDPMETTRVYFIGNSLTLSLTLDRVYNIAKDQGHILEFGSQLSGAKSLIRHMNYTDEPGQNWVSWETNVLDGESWLPDPDPYIDTYPRRFGLYDSALVNHAWDYLILQTYSGNLHDDLLAISTFMDLALAQNPDIQVLVYSTWPTRSNNEKIDYQELWDIEYTSDANDTTNAANFNVYTRDYSRKLLTELDSKYPDISMPVQIIPTGDVLYEVDRQIKKGELGELETLAINSPSLVPGYESGTFTDDGVNVLYADKIHLNPTPHKSSTVGIFISGTAMAASILGENPVGFSAKDYDMDETNDYVLIQKLQSIIYDVLSSDPRSPCFKFISTGIE